MLSENLWPERLSHIQFTNRLEKIGKGVISFRVNFQTPTKGHILSVKCVFYTSIEMFFRYFDVILTKVIDSEFIADIHSNQKSIPLELSLCFVDYMNTVQLGRLLNFSLSKPSLLKRIQEEHYNTEILVSK